VIPRAHLAAWRQVVPWADDAQIEQDLVLTRAVVELFGEPLVRDQLVLRGGTALHKLIILPPSRYSEDIDLVQRRPGAIGEVLTSIRGRLDPWLGEPRRRRGPSSVTLVYRFEAETLPAESLRLKIEINTREHFSVLAPRVRSLMVDSRWFHGEARVTLYHLDESLGTKLRALYQRRKGRDLFDLWLALDRGLIDPRAVVHCFRRYMDHAGTPLSRAEFEANLAVKAADRAFLEEVRPLLATGVRYDPEAALGVVRGQLVALLPGEPWRGGDT
jgi:predicted nucleotidyltransferase component of viral defense system